MQTPAPYRWLTNDAIIEPVSTTSNDSQRWLVSSRREQLALGEARLDRDGTLHCPLNAVATARQAVALRIQNQLNQPLHFDPNDTALIDLQPAADHADCDHERYHQAVVDCCVGLGITDGYGERHHLPLMLEPASLSMIGSDVFDRPQYLATTAAPKWQTMVEAAATDGVVLQAVSAFRDYRYQAQLIQTKLNRGITIEQILQVNTAPGFSEHHTGRAIDITTPGSTVLEACFAETDAFVWLQQYAQHHGFEMSYPANNIHGVAYEPWHWCWRDDSRPE